MKLTELNHVICNLSLQAILLPEKLLLDDLPSNFKKDPEI